MNKENQKSKKVSGSQNVRIGIGRISPVREMSQTEIIDTINNEAIQKRRKWQHCPTCGSLVPAAPSAPSEAPRDTETTTEQAEALGFKEATEQLNEGGQVISMTEWKNNPELNHAYCQGVVRACSQQPAPETSAPSEAPRRRQTVHAGVTEEEIRALQDVRRYLAGGANTLDWDALHKAYFQPRLRLVSSLLSKLEAAQ